MTAFPSGSTVLHPTNILKEARLSPGMHYADFGAGSLGAFVFAAARLVGPRTKVYAVDILRGALEGIQSRARFENVTNIETVWGDIEKPGGVAIPDASLDLVTLVNLSWLLKTRPGVLEEVKRVLKKEGKFLVVDWHVGAIASFGPSTEHRSSPSEIQAYVEKTGMVTMKQFGAGTFHWGLLFRMSPYKNYGIKEVG